VQAQSLGRVVLSRKDAKARSLRDVFFTQRHRGALAELGRMCFFSQSRRDAELGRRILARRGVETRSWEGCFFSRKDAKTRSLMDVCFSQRRRDAELGRVFGHAKAQRCKRKVWEELFCHAKTQRRGV
jgi:hypothetical protein